MSKSDTSSLLGALEETCNQIAEECADATGFVPIRSLLHRFGAKLTVRPLLVEGLLAKRADAASQDSAVRWQVLIDEDKWPLEASAIATEQADTALPDRARFTIAHELAHSFAFRSTEFGSELKLVAAKNQNGEQFVQQVERLTDGLVSLLLWPQKRVDAFLNETEFPLSIDRLVNVRRQQGISRPALIYRLRRLIDPRRGGPIEQPANRNVGVGIGEWESASKAILRQSPVFLNFDQNILPELFLRLRKEERLPASSVFADKEFALCGGESQVSTYLSSAGLAAADPKVTMPVEVSIEAGQRRAGAVFLYCVRRKSDRTPLTRRSPSQLPLNQLDPQPRDLPAPLVD